MCQGNILQCPYCETPKTALQGDRMDNWSSSQWQTTCNNTCTGSVQPKHHTCGTGTGWQQQLPELHQERTIPPSVLRLSAIGWERLDWGLGNNVAYGHKPTFAGPDRTGKKVLFTDDVIIIQCQLFCCCTHLPIGALLCEVLENLPGLCGWICVWYSLLDWGT